MRVGWLGLGFWVIAESEEVGSIELGCAVHVREFDIPLRSEVCAGEHGDGSVVPVIGLVVLLSGLEGELECLLVALDDGEAILELVSGGLFLDFGIDGAYILE